MKKPKGPRKALIQMQKANRPRKNPKVKHPKVETRRDKQEIATIATSRWENTNSEIGFFTFFSYFFFVSGKNASCF